MREMVHHMDDVRRGPTVDVLRGPMQTPHRRTADVADGLMYAFDPFVLEDVFHGLYHFPPAVDSVRQAHHTHTHTHTQVYMHAHAHKYTHIKLYTHTRAHNTQSRGTDRCTKTASWH